MPTPRLMYGTILAATAFAGMADAQVVIGAPATLSSYGELGSNVSTNALGQSFISPGGTLTDFTFYPTLGSGYVKLVVAGIVGSQTGLPLYSSAPIMVRRGALTFSGIGLTTVVGGSYIGYLTSYQVPGATTDTFLYAANSAYGQGSLLLHESSSADPAGAAFRAIPDDLAFQAVFTPVVTSSVPEPLTWMSMLIGFGLFGYAMRTIQGRLRTT